MVPLREGEPATSPAHWGKPQDWVVYTIKNRVWIIILFFFPTIPNYNTPRKKNKRGTCSAVENLHEPHLITDKTRIFHEFQKNHNIWFTYNM